ncbi:MAG: ABC transporter ATP-binding protein [Deltaproteobacteria bacterium]|nr:ABC transporter ATP-binding protein [Deltaproteobacteria bacterium]
MLLEVSQIHTYYDDSHVLDGIILEVARGELVAVLGRNGVGKSTTLKSIMGIAPARSGSIRFKGKEIQALPPYRIARMGIGYVPEERRIFPELTVRENLIMGLKNGKEQNPRWTIDRAYGQFPQLAKRDSALGSNLSGGEQQMLTLVRTLMGEPELILIDEPSEGLSPIMAEAIFALIKEIHREGVAVLLVDRNLPFTCGLAERVYIMVKGTFGYTGTGPEVLENTEIQAKFLAV